MKENKLLEIMTNSISILKDKGDISESLMKSITKHKLQPYYKKFQDGELQQELEKQIKDITDHYNLSISFLMDLQESLSEPIVVVKGFSNYHITNGRILLRGTADIDLLAHNPYKLKDLLLSNDFIEVKSETGHELSELQRGDLFVDLHKFVPVVSYPQDINDISLKNKMCTEKGAALNGEISYFDVIENSIKITEKILVPNVNLSLVILCSSIFRDYITRVDQLPHFKLINLVEVYLLLQEEGFNIDEFQKLVIKFNAEHSVEFVNYLLKEVYQVSLLKSAPKLNWYPQILLWNFNQWFIPNDLVSTVLNVSFENTLLNLGASPIQINNQEILAIDLLKDKRIVSHYAAKENERKPIFLELKWFDDLHLKIFIQNVKEIHENDIVNINFGVNDKKITLFGSEERQKSFGARNNIGNIIYEEETKTLVTEITITSTELNSYLSATNKLGMNIFIEKHEDSNEINCVIPMIIIRDEV